MSRSQSGRNTWEGGQDGLVQYVGGLLGDSESSQIRVFYFLPEVMHLMRGLGGLVTALGRDCWAAGRRAC